MIMIAEQITDQNVVQVFSPNYPFPYQPYIVCRYFIYGMQDSQVDLAPCPTPDWTVLLFQNLERVVLSFEKFDIPDDRKQVHK